MFYRLSPILAMATLVCAVASGCQPEPEGAAIEAMPDGAPPEAPNKEAVEEPVEESPSKPPEDSKPLEDGSHSVFGLKMPRGMMPIAVPIAEVHRFEGTHQLTVLRRYLFAQLEMPMEPVEEPGGAILVRQARVKEGGEEGARLGLRIFVGSLEGGSVDVWKETAPFDPSNKSGKSQPPAPDPWSSLRGGKDGEERVGAPVSKIPSERRRQLWELMERMQKGESPTPRDSENPYFH